MKKIARLLILKGLLALCVRPVMANTIEGSSPFNGQLKTYSVYPAVKGTTGVQALPVIVVQGSSTDTIIVTFSTGAYVYEGNPPWQVAVSSLSSVATGQTTVNTGAAVPCYPAESRFRQGVLYNTTDRDAVGALTVWIGSSTVTPANGFPLKTGSAYGPDDPYYFSGTIYCASTAAAASTSYIYHYKP